MTDLPQFSPATDLLGTRIADIEGTFIGQVSELLVDSASGRIAYIRIRLGDCELPGSQQLVVPWSSIRTASRKNAAWQLPIARSALDKLVKGRST